MGMRLRNRLPGPTVELLDRLAGLAEKIGTRAFLVGGVVRDALLHELGRREFSSPPDLDVVVVTDVVELKRELEKLLKAKPRVEASLRTLAFPAIRKFPELDLATARWESYPEPAALPRIVPTTSLSFDLARRDFTVNTLAVSLPLEEESEVVCYGSAIEDLLAGKLRVLHPRSFIDDPTRLVRLAHYRGLLAFEIEQETLSLASQAVEQGLHLRVAGPRLKGQLVRLCRAEYQRGGYTGEHDLLARLRALSELGLLKPLLGGDELPDPKWVKGMIENAAITRPRVGGNIPREELILAALLRKLSPERSRAVELARWYELSGGLIEAVEEADDELSEEFDHWWQLSERSSPARAALEFCLSGWPPNKVEVWWILIQQVKEMVDGEEVARLTGLSGPALGEAIRLTRERVFELKRRGRDVYRWHALIPRVNQGAKDC